MSDLEKIKDAINYYFINHDCKLINDNLNIFDYMVIKVIKTFSRYINNYEIRDYQQFNIYSIEERFKFVKNFFSINNIQFDLDKIINDGTIGFNTETYEKEIDNNRLYGPFFGGSSYHGNNQKKLIDVPNTGYFFDSAVLVHEISHYRNQPDEKESIARNIFTETLAYTEEVIFYLQNMAKHNEECEYGIKGLIYSFHYCINKLYPVIRLFNVYYNFSDISSEYYRLLYKNSNNYESIIATQIKAIKNNEYFNVLASVRMLIASLLVPYLTIKYQTNPLFIEKIEKLHEKMDTCSINEILKFIGLEGNIYEIIDELTIYLDTFTSDYLERLNYVRK
jgi:hypothetical protein